MPFERSSGIIVFRRVRGKIYYLLLHYGLGHWGFSKGHIEKGETLQETAKRELKEETGIKEVKIIPGFKEWFKYFFKRKQENIFKVVTYFLGETKGEKVKISFEHTGYKWLTYKEALKQLTFKNTKDILKKANDFLLKRKNEKRNDIF